MAQASSYPAKSTPAAADRLMLLDSAASDAIKLATIAQVLNGADAGVAYVPELRFGGGNTGLTYFYRDGRYLKIGSMVAVAGAVQINARGSSTGNATISMPFASNASGLLSGSLGVTFDAMASNFVCMSMFVTSGSAIANVMGLAAAAAGMVQLTHAAFGAYSILRYSGIYFV